MIQTVTYLRLCLAALLVTPLLVRGEDVPGSNTDEAAVRKAGAAYVDAFNAGDLTTLASLWSPDGVYVNRIDGEQVVGRAAIAAQFKSLFETTENLKLAVEVDSIQFVSPNVALEHGIASFLEQGADPETVEYSAVYVRRDGNWLLDRVTDQASRTLLSNYEQLKSLEWFIGSWVDQDENVRIVTDCNWTKNKNFITRSFTVSAAGDVELSGMQIIGWDAAVKKIRSWTFDSDGGFAQGVWSNSKGRWYVHKKGTTASGETTTAVNHITTVDDETFAFESTQRTLAGELLPNIDEVLVVRQ